MKLKQWLKLKRMSQSQLARLAGTSTSTINRHITHGRVLDPKIITRIYHITTGAVRPDDFYDLESCPPDLQVYWLGHNSNNAAPEAS